MGCKQSKTKTPERNEAEELEEKLRAEKEAQAKLEAERASAAKAAEEEEAARRAAELAKAEQERREREEREAAEKAERDRLAAEAEAAQAQEALLSDTAGAEEARLAMSVADSSEGTLSTLAAGGPSTVAPTEVTKTVKITVASHGGAAMLSGRSVTPCDMVAVDQLAKYVSVQCGCYLGDAHDENTCTICRNMDLSDAPLLN